MVIIPESMVCKSPRFRHLSFGFWSVFSLSIAQSAFELVTCPSVSMFFDEFLTGVECLHPSAEDFPL